MGKTKFDSRSVGLDIGLTFSRWLTGKENLHYGMWEGLDICAGNVGPAQEAYTATLFKLLPDCPLRILDIGGGAGETAKKLIALGHQVEIVVPSAFLAERCRANAPEARVHEAMFEDADLTGPFDLCLFSESFQYIPLDQGISKCLPLLKSSGHILIADCFRSEGFAPDSVQATVGGGHPIQKFRDFLATQPVEKMFEEDITQSVAPSIDVEQGMFNVVGYGMGRVDAQLADQRPKTRSLIQWVIRRVISPRKRARLDQRLNQKTRTAAHFSANNTYLMVKLQKILA
ncbi:methyltransferase domain-containing protein [Yoonia sp.]|uniref:class I SAM-dependent methyltransferase n=1 Tax=Yoonia sp. TaxID=2212373 RepID=UPI0023A422DA|nr:methyltransferase domain-containing protein [Yoonia sp.]MDE0850790.1 SAM-dependent methyltransferase [Yoonia sp.]